jgi:uncharacterized membrane protein YheB (UPF0754 family)
MEVFILLSMMIIIGAAIGGVTNSLAIKMLFRPYKAIYFRNWRVPFTPGLIPKRREELAIQLGEMVVTHLLTAEGLATKLNDSKFKSEVYGWITEKLDVFLSNGTIETKLTDWVGIKEPKQLVRDKSSQLVEGKLQQIITELKEKEIEEILPGKLKEKMDENIPSLAKFITNRIVEYIESNEGKSKLSKMIDNFLAGRGMLGNMISMFLGNGHLVDKVQPELIKILKQDETTSLLEQLIVKEWNKLKKLEGQKLIAYLNEEALVKSITEVITNNLQLEKLLETPLIELLDSYRDNIFERWLPSIFEQSLVKIIPQMDTLLKKMELSNIVQAQVETFSVQRLEEMVLSISKREFKMITYLGALLGGTIGFVQGLIVMLIQ